MNDVAFYSFPTTIYAGPGARQRLAAALKDAGIRRPLLVTDRDLAKLEPVTQVKQVIQAGGVDACVFDGIWGNPLVSHVEAGVAAFRDAEADAIVAVGGGAAMDVAKCVALMVHHPGALLDYEDGKADARPVDQPLPYLVALPTTAGTGSEVGRSAVVSEDATHIKRIIFSPRLLPRLVLADPELTLKLPAKITAATGMDALTHLVESYLAKGTHPMCDGIAQEGIRIVAQSLMRCVAFANDSSVGSHEEHLHVRGAMLNAAMMGAVAFQKGLGVTHSCAHALSTVCDLHHGLANGILLPYTMAFNFAAEPDRFAVMAQCAGLERHSGDAFVHWIEELRAAIGIPSTLAQVGVGREHMEALVEHALRDGCHQLNPRPVSRDDFHALFSQALGT